MNKQNSYRESSLKRIKAYQENMLRPLFHKQRKDLVQKKLLQKMDYANVIRRSYSRSKGSRTTDQLVIEETAQCAFDLHNIRKS